MENEKGRKIIFECVTGSKLYGTDNADSDDDFTGIFLPSTDDILGLQAPPKEWAMSTKISEGARNTVGDIDKKYYSLAQWLKMAADGQSWAVEMLFAPKDKLVVSTPEWEEVKNNSHLFLSKKSVSGVIGFALAQSHKASIKGENLNLIRDIIKCVESYAPNEYRREGDGKKLDFFDIMDKVEGDTFLTPYGPGDCVAVETSLARDGSAMIVVAGREFNVGRDLKWAVKELTNLANRYGSRSENAAATGTDWKSLYHAYRLMFQAKELLLTGAVTLPRPPREVEFLMSIRNEEYDADYRQELQDHIKDIDSVYKPGSFLPDEPNWSAINKLCQRIMHSHLFGTK